ncbi:hypothetical protein GEO21_00175 [Sphingobacterium faecium]|uniref:hypothetical protein n=1 Tax=Sphingobacterium faecium TaxID=34087 RepID=UPI00129191F0|nr:hypothetical protein [Sphingobacterium faecium]MQP25929.1 hypothetical protein [Sphingobacterium faecium]
MKNYEHQTKQAFLFSLAFYGISLGSKFFHFEIFPILFSISLLLSLIWVVLALREIIFSGRISNTERMLMALFIIFFNIIAGVFYFFKFRKKVIGKG